MKPAASQTASKSPTTPSNTTAQQYTHTTHDRTSAACYYLPPTIDLYSSLPLPQSQHQHSHLLSTHNPTSLTVYCSSSSSHRERGKASNPPQPGLRSHSHVHVWPNHPFGHAHNALANLSPPTSLHHSHQPGLLYPPQHPPLSSVSYLHLPYPSSPGVPCRRFPRVVGLSRQSRSPQWRGRGSQCSRIWAALPRAEQVARARLESVRSAATPQHISR